LLSSRFTCDDVASMIDKYQAGATIKQVATEYEIGLTSLKRLLRERKARRRDRPDVAETSL